MKLAEPELLMPQQIGLAVAANPVMGYGAIFAAMFLEILVRRFLRS